jgi:hypothetical protein
MWKNRLGAEMRGFDVRIRLIRCHNVERKNVKKKNVERKISKTKTSEGKMSTGKMWRKLYHSHSAGLPKNVQYLECLLKRGWFTAKINSGDFAKPFTIRFTVNGGVHYERFYRIYNLF